MPKQYHCKKANETEGIEPCPKGGKHSSLRAKNSCNSARNPLNGISCRVTVEPKVVQTQKAQQFFSCQQELINLRGRTTVKNKAMSPALYHGNVQRLTQSMGNQSRYPGWQSLQFTVLNYMQAANMTIKTPYQHRIYIQKAQKWFFACGKMFAIKETKSKRQMSNQEKKAYYQRIVDATHEYFEKYRYDQFLGLRKVLKSKMMSQFQQFLLQFKSIEKIQLQCDLFSKQVHSYQTQRRIYLQAYDNWFRNCPKNTQNKKDFEKIYQMEIRFQSKWKKSFYNSNPQYQFRFESQIFDLQALLFENLQILQKCKKLRKKMIADDVLSNYLVDGEFPKYVLGKISEEKEEKSQIQGSKHRYNAYLPQKIQKPVENTRQLGTKRFFYILSRIWGKNLDIFTVRMRNRMKRQHKQEKKQKQQLQMKQHQQEKEMRVK